MALSFYMPPTLFEDPPRVHLLSDGFVTLCGQWRGTDWEEVLYPTSPITQPFCAQCVFRAREKLSKLEVAFVTLTGFLTKSEGKLDAALAEVERLRGLVEEAEIRAAGADAAMSIFTDEIFGEGWENE